MDLHCFVGDTAAALLCTFFDEDRDLFVVISNTYQGSNIILLKPEELADGTDFFWVSLRAIRRIDISKIIVHEYTQDGESTQNNFDIQEPNLDAALFDLGNAHGDKFAVAIDGRMLSDFIYDYNPSGFRILHEEVVALALDGKWGAINREGDIAIPFIFEILS